MSAAKLGRAPFKRLAWTGAVLGALLGLVLQAPAHWLGAAVASASQQHVLLLNPQGTVWQGSADWALSPAHASVGNADNQHVTLPSRLQWRVWPSAEVSSLSMGLAIELNSSCCTPMPLRAFVGATLEGLRLSFQDQASTWPAHWLVGLGAPWNTVEPDGTLQLQTQQLAWLQPWFNKSLASPMTGQVQLQWQHLSTRLSTLRPLGSYRVTVKGGDTMQVELETMEGSLQLHGQGQWLNHRLRFRGEATAQPDAEAALSNLLNVLGQRRGNKSFMELG